MKTKVAARPNATEAAGRLLALRPIVSHALAAPPRELIAEWLTQWNEEQRKRFEQENERQCNALWDSVKASPIFAYLSPKERELAATTALTMSSQQQLDAMWRMEAVQVLMWALRLLPGLPYPDTQADGDILQMEIPADLLRTAALRSQAEIDHARDVAELWHWRSRTEQLIRSNESFPADESPEEQGFHSYLDIVRAAARAAYENNDIPLVLGDDFPVMGKPYAKLNEEQWANVRSITTERHYTLNWLCGFSHDNDWDTVPTET